MIIKHIPLKIESRDIVGFVGSSYKSLIHYCIIYTKKDTLGMIKTVASSCEYLDTCMNLDRYILLCIRHNRSVRTIKYLIDIYDIKAFTHIPNCKDQMIHDLLKYSFTIKKYKLLSVYVGQVYRHDTDPLLVYLSSKTSKSQKTFDGDIQFIVENMYLNGFMFDNNDLVSIQQQAEILTEIITSGRDCYETLRILGRYGISYIKCRNDIINQYISSSSLKTKYIRIIAVIDLLCKRGFYCTMFTQYGVSIISLAMQYNHDINTICYLINRPNINHNKRIYVYYRMSYILMLYHTSCDMKTRDENTIRIISRLIDNGLNVDIIDDKNMSYFDYFVDHINVLAYLMSMSSNIHCMMKRNSGCLYSTIIKKHYKINPYMYNKYKRLFARHGYVLTKTNIEYKRNVYLKFISMLNMNTIT